MDDLDEKADIARDREQLESAARGVRRAYFPYPAPYHTLRHSPPSYPAPHPPHAVVGVLPNRCWVLWG